MGFMSLETSTRPFCGRLHLLSLHVYSGGYSVGEGICRWTETFLSGEKIPFPRTGTAGANVQSLLDSMALEVLSKVEFISKVSMTSLGFLLDPFFWSLCRCH